MTDLILNNRVLTATSVLTVICLMVISWGNGATPPLAIGTIVFFGIVDAIFFTIPSEDSPEYIDAVVRFKLQMTITAFACLVMTETISSASDFYFILVLPVLVLTWLITFVWIRILQKTPPTQ